MGRPGNRVVLSLLSALLTSAVLCSGCTTRNRDGDTAPLPGGGAPGLGAPSRLPDELHGSQVLERSFTESGALLTLTESGDIYVGEGDSEEHVYEATEENASDVMGSVCYSESQRVLSLSYNYGLAYHKDGVGWRAVDGINGLTYPTSVLSDDGTAVATGVTSVRVFDTSTGRLIRHLKEFPGADFLQLLGIVQGRLIVDNDGEITVWNVDTGDREREFSAGVVGLSRDGFAALSGKEVVNLTTGKVVDRRELAAEVRGELTATAVGLGGSFVAAGAETGFVAVYEITERSTPVVTTRFDESIVDLSFSGARKLLVMTENGALSDENGPRKSWWVLEVKHGG